MRNEMLALIAGMAAVTYLTRISFLYLFRNLIVPDYVSRGFRFIPIGIIIAIIVPGLLVLDGRINLSWNNFYLLAGLASAMAALRWRNMFASLAAGMSVMILLKSLGLG
ncbi:MAG: hypothetical protein FD169_2042 [Bacillota bacterium]|nr:MAG: hypothetical protein FD169_2042 [Bacillota bacterium]